jgi:hypothetical protein
MTKHVTTIDLNIKLLGQCWLLIGNGNETTRSQPFRHQCIEGASFTTQIRIPFVNHQIIYRRSPQINQQQYDSEQITTGLSNKMLWKLYIGYYFCYQLPRSPEIKLATIRVRTNNNRTFKQNVMKIIYRLLFLLSITSFTTNKVSNNTTQNK